MYPELEMNQAELLDKWIGLTEMKVASDPEWNTWVKSLPMLENGQMPEEEILGIPEGYLSHENYQSVNEGVEQLSNVVKTRMRWSLFYEYVITSFIVETGLAWPQDIVDRQQRLLNLKPDPAWIDVYRYWHETQHPLIDRNRIEQKWETAITQLDGTDQASAAVVFLNQVRPEDTREKLKSVIGMISTFPAAMLPELLPSRHIDSINLQDLIEEHAKSHGSSELFIPNNDKEESNPLKGYFDNLISVCNLARKLGHEDLTESLHRYLLRTTESVDMSQVESYVVFRLIQYYLRSNVERQRKEGLIRKIEREANLGSDRLVTEIYLELLMDIGELDKAYKNVSSLTEPSFYHVLADLIYYSVKAGRIKEVRAVQSKWLNRQVAFKKYEDQKRAIRYRNFLTEGVLQSWTWAARNLLEEGIDIYGEPELEECCNLKFPVTLEDISHLVVQTGELKNILPLLENLVNQGLRIHHAETMSNNEYRALVQAIIRLQAAKPAKPEP